MREFLSPHNVPFYWEDRLKEEDGYTLYVSDCFWMLATKDFYEDHITDSIAGEW